MTLASTSLRSESGADAAISLQIDFDRAIDAACAKVAPSWPLQQFVAVNPFLGFTGRSFAATCATMRRVMRADMLMPRPYYRALLASGVVGDADLAEALADMPPHWPVPASVEALRAAVESEWVADAPNCATATVAEILDRVAAGDRQASRTALMADEISKWCAAWFDQGQAVWRMPGRDHGPYTAWRVWMRHDRNPEAMGVKGFRATVASMPADPRAAIATAVRAVGIPPSAVADYLERALFDIRGWAAHARYLAWDGRADGAANDLLVHLLAIRIVWGYALFRGRSDAAFDEAWQAAMAEAARSAPESADRVDHNLAIDLILQTACERAFQRRLLSALAERPVGATASRRLVQAIFCIDVRSELYRRALETVAPDAQTIGFAGFFGFPMEYVRFGATQGAAQCPVLIKPHVTVCETIRDADAAEERRILDVGLLRRRVAKVWKAFKLQAVSSFTYVEAAGLLFALRIIGDALGHSRTSRAGRMDGLDVAVRGRIVPRLAPAALDGRATGFDLAQRLSMAEAALRAMSLTRDFARIVMVTGHGGSTVNNPYASALDCGACGGHSGEPNARVAATILNDPAIRSGLAPRGIMIPDDTWFLACLHDTTTDEIRIFEADLVPQSHRGDIDRLRDWLARASARVRAERASRLGLSPDGAVDRQMRARSRDWSQVRPEWGLAGNAAFIAAPRARTAGVRLDGRAFLQDYDHAQDPELSVLRLILTAPLVVASWINLQYYASTVNNRAFGAGNKVLHNVVGGIGVLEGATGDLRIGLPWQSLHDGARLVHEPLRLTAIIAAPPVALNAIIASTQAVRDLVDHQWVNLFAMAETGRVTHRYRGDLKWEALA